MDEGHYQVLFRDDNFTRALFTDVSFGAGAKVITHTCLLIFSNKRLLPSDPYEYFAHYWNQIPNSTNLIDVQNILSYLNRLIIDGASYIFMGFIMKVRFLY